MAKLFIGCDYVDFSYAEADYSGVLSKIILEEKTIYRIDYTCKQGIKSGRFEVGCEKDNKSDSLLWTTYSGTTPELATILQSVIRKNQYILELEN